MKKKYFINSLCVHITAILLILTIERRPSVHAAGGDYLFIFSLFGVVGDIFVYITFFSLGDVLMYAEKLLKEPLKPTTIIQTVYLSISGRYIYICLKVYKLD